jgi:virulence-associated protein VapD
VENRRRRYINFDLDSAGLREALGGESGRKQAYSFIKTYMVKQGFEHRQGSAYMSNRPRR